MKETRGISKREESTNPRVIPGQKTYLLSKSPLRCYYYAKADRARWSTADRSVQGMRWNAYLLRGKATPHFSPMEPEMHQQAAHKMKEVQAGHGTKAKDEKKRHLRESMGAVKRDRGKSAKGAASLRTLAENNPLASQVTPISAHPSFRHLRLVSMESREPARVIRIAGNGAGPAGQNARSVSFSFPRAESSAPVESSPAAVAIAAAFAINAGCQCEIAPAAPLASELMPDVHAVPVLETGKAEALPTVANARQELKTDAAAVQCVPVTLFALRMAGNDNARPGGFDEERALPSSGALPTAVHAVQRPHSRPSGVGYISSAPRKIAQLKQASGAASVPQ